MSFFSGLVKRANYLSLGLSMVVAVFLSSALGYWAYTKTNWQFFFWFGLFIGIAAAFLNLYKIYKLSIRDFDDLEKSVKYKNYKLSCEDED